MKTKVDFADPGFFPHRFEFDVRRVVFRNMTRSTLSASTFLDDRIVSDGSEEFLISEREFVSGVTKLSNPNARLNFVFHVAFCGSTLLCRCLDVAGRCLPYKEPWILHQLAFRIRQHDGEEERLRASKLLQASARLLQRTFHGDEHAVVKPTDSCSNIAHQLLKATPGSRALLLYRPLRPFLASVLKAPDRRQYIRRMTFRAQRDLAGRVAFADVIPDELSDARLSAYVWAALMYSFLDLLRAPEVEIRSVDADMLLDYPTETLTAVANHFEMPLSRPEAWAIVRSGAFQWDSKFTHERFNHAAYRAERARVRLGLAEEMTDAVEWLSERTLDDPVSAVLPRPLPT